MTVPQFIFFPVFTAILAGSMLFGYDSPKFDNRFIDSDALLLEPNEKERVIEALNALASNFPDSPLVDEDIKEKALALALNLDPLNVNSRMAHRALLRGSQPAKTAYFTKSVSEISETLWTAARNMSSGKSAEPEAGKLALYLEELSLVISPEPALAKIRSYSDSTKGKGVPWDKCVKLQPKDNPSGRKVERMFAALRSSDPGKLPGQSEKKTRPKPVPNMEAGRNPIAEKSKGPSPRPKPVPAEKPQLIKLKKVSLPFIVQIETVRRSGSLGGTASLEITPATEADAGFFGASDDLTASRGNSMRLIPHSRGFQVAGFDKAERLIRKTYPQWPERMFAEIRFDSELPRRSPPRLTTARSSLATALLLQSVFSGVKPHSDVAFTGYIANDPGTGEPVFSCGENLIDILDQGKQLKPDFLALPDEYEKYLIEGAIKSRDLTYLFDPQLLSYDNWDQIKESAFSSTDKRDQAADEFKKIQEVQDRMSLVDLAKNPKVQERLEKIIETCPQHLSARVMLAFGKAPDDPQALIREAVREIDDILRPFVGIVRTLAEAPIDDIPDLEFPEAKENLEEAERSISKMRSTIQADAKDYLFQAEAFLETVDKFLKVSNRTTSLGEQKMKELGEAFKELRTIRESLGVE